MNDPARNRPYVDPTSVAADAMQKQAAAAAAPAELPAWQKAAVNQRPRVRQAPVRPKVPPPPKGSYLASHWRGEQSLVRSYWVNNVVLATPFAMALTGLMGWISAKGDSLQISAIVLLVGFPLLLALSVWCTVGGWRSASAYLNEQGSLLWGWLARISLGLGALQLAVSVVFGFLPSLDEYWQMARGIDPIGQAKFSLSGDGRSLRLDGVIGMGDGARLRALLESDAARDLRRVELSSPGGRVREAEKMAAALKQHGHGSRAVGTCASACTLVFLAGQPRQLTPGARLGFHRASSGTYNPVFDELANQALAESYRDLGLPQSMIDKTLRTPSRGMWFVPRDELVTYQLIAPLPQTLAIAVPPAGVSRLPDFEDALRIHPVWDALDQHTDGTITAVAQRMFELRNAGATDDEIQAAALPLLAKQMPGLINSSSVALRRRYVQLVADQLKALQQPAEPGGRPACRDLLDGQLSARQLLPLPLQMRESEWLLEAATGAPPRWLPRPATGLEAEVLTRSVGSGALGMLSRLWADTPEGPGRTACEPVLATLNRVFAQPPARRELAERLMFQAGR